MNTKILCVDDEPNILQGYKRTLRKDFDIYIAEGGEQGLSVIESDGPFAVIVSDMRMPRMDGIQFLTRAKERAPESIRIMLTGNSDQQTARDAVNQGNIFRFLTKPCQPESFAQTLAAGIEQYRLITAEKELLEHTLTNSLQVLVDILALSNPTAFNRSTRVKQLAGEIARNMGLENIWEVEIAAMLSQIGCVTVPEDTLQKIISCQALTEKELGLYHNHPNIGAELISRIPRMETVAQIIANQNRRINDDTDAKSRSDRLEAITIGARILKVVLDYDKFLVLGNLPSVILKELAGRVGWYDPIVLETLSKMIAQKVNEYISLNLSINDLKPGMFLDKPLISNRGTLLLSAGQEITLSLILRLANFVDAGIISGKIQVKAPVN